MNGAALYLVRSVSYARSQDYCCVSEIQAMQWVRVLTKLVLPRPAKTILCKLEVYALKVAHHSKACELHESLVNVMGETKRERIILRWGELYDTKMMYKSA